MITDYGSLKTAIALYAQRSDLTTDFDTLVQSSISKINKACRATQMEKRATITVTTSILSLPDDFLELRLIYKDEQEPLTFITLDQMRFDEPLSKENSYTIYGDQLEISPDITEDTDLEAIYYASIPFFTVDTDTHDLLTNYPMIFLYGAMIDFSLAFYDDERINLFQSMFNDEVVTINNHAQMSRHSGTPLQIRVT